MLIFSKFLAKGAMCAVFATVFCQLTLAQAALPAAKTGKAATKVASPALPKVTRIDIEGLKKLLKPNGRPLLINFWATWCDPCREEFPDLVKLDAAYRGKIEFITISLDDPAEIDTLVPKFLGEVKAEMPAYLLSTPDESTAITMVSKDWRGNLPLTILFTAAGGTAYSRNGKIRYEAVTAEIDKVLAAKPLVSDVQIVDVLPITEATYTYEQGVAAAEKDMAAGQYKLLRYGLTIAIPPEQLNRLKQKYGVTVEESGCMVASGYEKYVAGYNAITAISLKKKFGPTVLKEIAFAATNQARPTNVQ